MLIKFRHKDYIFFIIIIYMKTKTRPRQFKIVVKYGEQKKQWKQNLLER